MIQQIPEIVVELSPPPPPTAVTVSEVGLVGPRGPQGAPGPAGAGYPYRQDTPAATWTVTHNLGRYSEPLLILDDDPETPVRTDLYYPDADHTVIVLPAPATGWAYF